MLGRLDWRDRSRMRYSDLLLKSRSAVPPRCGWLVTLIVASSGVLVSCDRPPLVSISDHPSNKARGVLYGRVTCNSDTRYINGEMNYGIGATLTVRNVGPTGFIRVTIILKCSEGEWSRSEELALCAGEYRTLDYFFYEPTRNAVNIECRASVSPTVSP
jgi:hypothetical protein